MSKADLGAVLPVKESLKYFFKCAEKEGERLNRGGKEHTGFRALDGTGISFLEPGVTFVSGPPENLQADFLVSISLRQALSQGRDTLFLSIGQPANYFVIKSLSQMTNVHNCDMRHLALDAKKITKLSKSVSKLKVASLSVCEIPFAKKSWIEEGAVRQLKAMKNNKKLPPLLVVSGIEEIGKSFNGKKGKKAYKDFARYLKLISEVTNSHIITDWPVKVGEYSEKRAMLHDVFMYKWIVKKEFQAITVHLGGDHGVLSSSRSKFNNVLLGCYGPRHPYDASVILSVRIGGLKYKDCKEYIRHC